MYTYVKRSAGKSKLGAASNFTLARYSPKCMVSSALSPHVAQAVTVRLQDHGLSESAITLHSLATRQAERLTLRKADNKAGYANVTMQSGTRPYRAQLKRSGQLVRTLGNFATAEEAALCIARSPEGQAAAAAAAVPPKVPLTREQALQQAQAEGLALRKAETKAGYANVTMLSVTRAKPYQAQVTRSGTTVTLGTFATAEEAALCVARSPEGQRAAELACAVVLPRTQLAREQALQQAQAEGILLRKADNKSGYSNVTVSSTRPKPYHAQVTRDGKNTVLGSFDTAEEAALCVARSPEGQLAIQRVAKRAAAPPPLTREQALQQARAEGLTLRKSNTKAGYANVTKFPAGKGLIKPYLAQIRRLGQTVTLGTFVTAEEAALYVARSPHGREVAERAATAEQAAAAALPRTQLREQAPQQAQAQAEGLALRNFDNRAGHHPNVTVLPSVEALQQAWDATIGAVALEIIYQAAEAAAVELGAEVAAEVMAGITLGL